MLEFVEGGQKVAVFPRTHKATYRFGRPNMTTARREHVECWYLDPEALRSIRRVHAPKALIVFETDTEDFWISRFDDWFDPEKRHLRPIGENGGRTYVMLPTHLMKHSRSNEDLSFSRK